MAAACRIEAVEPRTLLASVLTPDPGFGVAGQAAIDMLGHGDVAQAVVALPGGKLLVGGTATAHLDEPSPWRQDVGRGAVVRLNSDGSLDTSFAVSGRFVTDLVTRVTALALQADGSIVVAGTYNPQRGLSTEAGESVFAAARLHSDGSLDKTFGEEGGVRIDFDGIFEYAADVTVAPDGKIVLVGTVGLPDPPLPPPLQDPPELITLPDAQRSAPDVVFANCWYNVGPRKAAVARLNADGSLDASFDGDGKATPDVGGNDEFGLAVAVTSGDRVVIGGYDADRGNALLARLNADGSVDTGFRDGGRQPINARLGSILDLAVLADGDLLAAGHADLPRTLPAARVQSLSNDDGGVSRAVGVAVARFNPDGSLDNAFGDGGVVVVSSDLTPLSVVDVVLQEMADGTFTVAAGGNGSAYAAVVTANGTIIRSGGSGPDATRSPAFGVRWAVAVQPDGKIVLVGTDRFFNGPLFFPPDVGGRTDEAGGGADAAKPDFLIERFNWGEKDDAPAPEAPAPAPPQPPADPAPTDPGGGGQAEGDGGGAGDRAAPVVSARFIGSPVVGRRRSYVFKVSYAPAGGPGGAPLLPAMLGDLIVTDPSGAYRSATLLRVARGRVAGAFVARYRLDAPSGVFDASDAGRYTVRLGGRLVAPTGNAPAPGVGDTVGTFEVRDRRRPSRAIGQHR